MQAAVCTNVVDSFAWLRAQLYGNICRTMRRERQLYFSRALLMKKNAFVTKNLEEEGFTPTPSSKDDPWGMPFGEMMHSSIKRMTKL